MQEIKQLLLFACFDNNKKPFIVFLKRGSSGEEVVTTYLNELCVYRDSPNYV